MQLAAKRGYSQLHVEGESDETYGELANMADKAGLAREKLVRHYAPPRVDESYTHGLTPSVLAGSGSIERLMETFESSSHGFMLETDYMDDPKRPGAVLGPKTVPKRTRQLLAAGLDEEIRIIATRTYLSGFMVQSNQEFMTLNIFGRDGGNCEESYSNLDSLDLRVCTHQYPSPRFAHRCRIGL